MTRWHSRGGSVLGPGVAAILLLLAVSCESSTPASYSYGPVPPAVTSTHLRPTVEAMEVERYAQAIQAERAKSAAEATLAVFWAQETAQAQERAAAATATRTAWEAQSTATAWAATATAASHQATATAQAQSAAATATATSWAATATADAIAWAQAATATRAAWEIGATATRTTYEAVATAQAAQAEKARLEAERARLTYPVKAYGPWVLLAVAFALLVWAGYRLTLAGERRLRAIPRDARGDAPILSTLTRKGETITDPDLMLYPVLEIRPNGVSQPQLAPAEYQAQVKARDQAVDLMSRGLPGQAAARSKRRLPPNFAGGLRRVIVLRRLDQAAVAGVLPPPMAQALEADWQRIQEEEQ